jgi:hypothetical protein
LFHTANNPFLKLHPTGLWALSGAPKFFIQGNEELEGTKSILKIEEENDEKIGCFSDCNGFDSFDRAGYQFLRRGPAMEALER